MLNIIKKSIIWYTVIVVIPMLLMMTINAICAFLCKPDYDYIEMFLGVLSFFYVDSPDASILVSRVHILLSTVILCRNSYTEYKVHLRCKKFDKLFEEDETKTV